MSSRRVWSVTPRARVLALAAAAVLGASAMHALADLGLPKLQDGEWTYRRSVWVPGAPTPHVTERTRCGSPSAEVARNIEALKAKHCVFSPIVRRGAHYRWSSRCPSGSESIEMQSILTVRTADAYEVVVEAKEGTKLSRTITTGRRAGACAIPPPLLRAPAVPKSFARPETK